MNINFREFYLYTRNKRTFIFYKDNDFNIFDLKCLIFSSKMILCKY